MHWDMEGVSGLLTREHVWFWEEGTREHIAAQGRQLLVADVNAAATAALQAGAGEMIVCDTHHGGGSLDLDAVLRDPRIVVLPKPVGFQGTERRWMPGLDETVDGLMLLGHHAKAGTKAAFLPHTWTLEWADFRINGRSVGEIGIEACYAGHWDVPLILVQGDRAACNEAEDQFPGVVTAAVKRAESLDLCSGPNPHAARQLTAQQVAAAIAGSQSGQVAPYKPALPMTVTIRMRTARAAAAAAHKPGVKRLDEDTVQARVERQCDVVKWILGTGLDMPPVD
jgi:D-amino peptidase